MLIHALVDGVERALLLPDFEELVRAGRIDAETPVRVGTAAAVPARELGIYRGVVDTPAAHFRAAWDRMDVPWATAVLCGLCVRSYLWAGDALGPAGVELRAAWTRSAADIVLRGQVGRLLSYAFVHASPAHILSNLTFLLYIGVALERVAGPWTILGLWAVSSAGGSLCGVVFAPEQVSVGASGVDYGFLAAAAVIGWRWLDLIPAAARTRFGGAMLAFTLYSLWGGVQDAGVDSWAHLGGLLAGGAYAAFVRPRSGPRSNLGLAAAGVAGVAAAMIGVRVAGWRLLPMEAAQTDGVTAERPAGWRAGWTQAGGMGWEASGADGDSVVAFGVGTERRGRDWTVEDAVDGVVAAYRDADPAVRVERAAVVLDGVDGVGLDLTWQRPGHGRSPVSTRSHVEVVVRGHYRHVVSMDARADAVDADGLWLRLRDAVRLVDPEALTATRADGTSLRDRTLRARALYDLGRTADALALFRDAEPSPPLALCSAEWRPACAPRLASAAASLASAPFDGPTWAAVVRARAASGDVPGALGMLADALSRAPEDPALLRLQRSLAVSTGSSNP